YGILKYLTTKEARANDQEEPQVEAVLRKDPEITFNYLGQFNTGTGNEPGPGNFEMSSISSGQSISPEMEQTTLIEINGLTVNDSLSLNISYNRLALDSEKIKKLGAQLKSNLQTIIRHAMNREEKEITPSDLGYTGITTGTLDRITSGVKRTLGQETTINSIYPLSPMQNGILFHQLAKTNTNAYFEQAIFNIAGEMDARLLEESQGKLIDRYDIFRTVFIHDGLEEPLQLVMEPGRQHVRFIYEDKTQTKEKKQTLAYLETIAREDREKGFELSGDMPMRITLIKTGEKAYTIIWSFHHII
ncbi:MAG: hypothetical protein GY757_45745, partial [bacterium]|nr:hypothetical protein [bacterium]